MRVYTVHLRRPNSDSERDLVLIKEGFSWPAFFFSVVWALWCRLWLVAIGLFVAETVLGAAFELLDTDATTETAVTIGFALIVGFVANDLKRRTLERRGLVETGVVAAADADAAVRRFCDLHPQFASDLVR